MRLKDLPLKLIATMGLPGVFIGLVIEFIGVPFPGELILLFTGFSVWDGHLNITGAIVAGTLGSWTGSIIAFLVSKHFGRSVLFKYGRYLFITPEKIEVVEGWFTKYKVATLVLGRFITGIRPLSSFVAGISQMELFTFAFFSLVGAFLWVAVFIVLGMIMGQNWMIVEDIIQNYTWHAIIALVLLALVYLLVKFKLKRTYL